MQSNELIHTNMDDIFDGDGYNWCLPQFGGYLQSLKHMLKFFHI